jgi:Ca2+/Na+ antiporter
MATLKKIGVLSLAKIYGSMMAVMGLIIGILMAIFYMTIPNLSGIPGSMMSYGLFGLWSIIFLPLFYGVLGFSVGAFTAWVYNLAAKHLGGLELELDKK